DVAGSRIRRGKLDKFDQSPQRIEEVLRSVLEALGAVSNGFVEASVLEIRVLVGDRGDRMGGLLHRPARRILINGLVPGHRALFQFSPILVGEARGDVRIWEG